MRTAFIRTLIDLAGADRRIFLLVGDLGYTVVEPFAEQFPDRFINVGVAEQNLMSVATGLALCGKVVFTYSIANFPTLRCLEQIRNDACYHRANVKIVAVGGGLSYGPLGMTHHATEDLAVVRALPGMMVVAPGDPMEAALATRAVAERGGPCYLRLGKAGEPLVHQGVPDFQIGEALRVRDGSDLTMIATGGMLHSTVEAAAKLGQRGISARVLS
ncbi:MAG TPA: transketolase C-terminal domain-containing protein, partial [Dehalococcoidia bacterium]|nr:transketolase C-terminal domain-containing protein [Dehalococcoidia bacterium]